MRVATKPTASVIDKSALAAISVFSTLFITLLLCVYLSFYYDEMHIKSTDHQLRDNLTHLQVLLDIGKIFLVTAATTALIPLTVYGLGVIAGIPRFGKRFAGASWSLMLVVILWISVVYYRETSGRIESERQWQLKTNIQMEKQRKWEAGEAIS